MKKSKTVSVVFPYDNSNFKNAAPVIELSLSAPLRPVPSIPCRALLDTGADVCGIPKTLARSLGLQKVDDLRVNFADDNPPEHRSVYAVEITVPKLTDEIVRAITIDRDIAIIGRELLNKWYVNLKAPDASFELTAISPK